MPIGCTMGSNFNTSNKTLLQEAVGQPGQGMRHASPASSSEVRIRTESGETA